MMVKGVETVFKAIITVVEDIAAAVGSFFQMLAKAVEDLITALSVLFHFGEIIHTHKWIRDQINANLDQVIDAMQKQVKPPVDYFSSKVSRPSRACSRASGKNSASTTIRR